MSYTFVDFLNVTLERMGAPGTLEIKACRQPCLPFGYTFGPRTAVATFADGRKITITTEEPTRYPADFLEWCDEESITVEEGMARLLADTLASEAKFAAQEAKEA